MPLRKEQKVNINAFRGRAMYENSVCDIELVPLTFWPPALARRAGEYNRRTATLAFTVGRDLGIAFGFAGAADQDDSLLQAGLQSVAVFTGLIG